MAVFLLSLAGLPPLAGFFGKFYLFSAALRSGNAHGLLWLVALALFGSLISLYYYLIVLKAIFFDENAGKEVAMLPADASPSSWPHATITLLAAIVIFLGLNPASLLSRIIASLP
jgi:NADH-quinone oxidoreductase subunit N